MSKILISWLIHAAALAAAAWLVPGISIGDDRAWITVAVMAVILGLVNALVRPFLKFLACPLLILTMGLFTLVINGLMLWFSSWVAGQLGVAFRVEGFMAAFWGALVVSVVSFLLSIIFQRDEKRRRDRKERVWDRW